jgi:hypothetical protein
LQKRGILQFTNDAPDSEGGSILSLIILLGYNRFKQVGKDPGRNAMDKSTNDVLDRLGTRPGQGSLLEQVEKLLRRQQRRNLYKMLDQIDKNKVGDLVSRLKNASRRSGEKGPRYCASRCQIGKGTTNYSGKPSAITPFSRFIA